MKAKVDGSKDVGPVSSTRFNTLDEAIRIRVAQELLEESDPERLIRYLRLFTRSQFPLDHVPLLALARHKDENVAHSAYHVLRNISHPTIRAHALELLEEGIPEKARYVIWLLTENPGPGDREHITSLINEETDEEELHSRHMAAREYFETNTELDAIPILLKIYQETPCAKCRGGIVDLLDELNALPVWICEEGIYDAESEVREIASSALLTQN